MLRCGLVIILVTSEACGGASTPAVPPTGVESDIAYLASRPLGGRAAGTRGGALAAAFLARRYDSLGLRPAFPATCTAGRSCDRSYFQYFRAGAGQAQNVGAIIDGTNPILRDEYILIGAHYDHLGTIAPDVPDGYPGRVLHPGADDNASGTAGTLELARRLIAMRTRRSILLVNFDAEEEGLIGSGVMVGKPPVPLRSVVLMVNLDMIGRLRDDHLIAEGTTSANVHALVDTASRNRGIQVEWDSSINDRSDQWSFTSEGIPAVELFTGFHRDYHRSTDLASLINVPGLYRIVDIAESIVRTAADKP